MNAGANKWMWMKDSHSSQFMQCGTALHKTQFEFSFLFSFTLSLSPGTDQIFIIISSSSIDFFPKNSSPVFTTALQIVRVAAFLFSIVRRTRRFCFWNFISVWWPIDSNFNSRKYGNKTTHSFSNCASYRKLCFLFVRSNRRMKHMYKYCKTLFHFMSGLLNGIRARTGFIVFFLPV